MRIPILSLESLLFAIIGGHAAEDVAVFVIGESTRKVNIFFWGFKRAVAKKNKIIPHRTRLVWFKFLHRFFQNLPGSSCRHPHLMLQLMP
jgi:hypothetical protein